MEPPVSCVARGRGIKGKSSHGEARGGLPLQPEKSNSGVEVVKGLLGQYA